MPQLPVWAPRVQRPTPCALNTAADLAASRLTGGVKVSIVQMAPGFYGECNYCDDSTYLPAENIPAGATLVVNGSTAGRSTISSSNLDWGPSNSSPGTLLINNVELAGDSDHAVYNRGTGTITVTNSTLAGTSANAGEGVVQNDSTGSINLLNVTISVNQGPLLYNVSSGGSINVRFSTLAGNYTGAVIHQGRGSISFYGSILSGVTCDHQVFSGGYNVESDASCIKSYGYSKVNSTTIRPRCAHRQRRRPGDRRGPRQQLSGELCPEGPVPGHR